MAMNRSRNRATLVGLRGWLRHFTRFDRIQTFASARLSRSFCGKTDASTLTEKPMPRADLQTAAQHIANAIFQKTTCGYPCYGRYLLQVRGEPTIPKPTSTVGRQVIDQAIKYIGVTGTANSQIEEQLISDPNGTMTIAKDARNCGSSVIVQVHSENSSTVLQPLQNGTEDCSNS